MAFKSDWVDGDAVTAAELNTAGGALAVANWLSPQVYTSGQYYYCHSPHSTNTNASSGNGTARASMWIVTAPITVSRLFMEFSAAGEAGSVFRVGLWADDGSNKPGTLIVDGGTLSTAGAPAVQEVTISEPLTPGVYWVGGAVQSAPSTQPTLRTVAGNVMTGFTPLGTSLPAANQAVIGFTQAMSGALTNFTAPTISASVPPRMGFKVA